MENWVSENFSDLLKITQLVSGKTRIQTKFYLLKPLGWLGGRTKFSSISAAHREVTQGSTIIPKVCSRIIWAEL